MILVSPQLERQASQPCQPSMNSETFPRKSSFLRYERFQFCLRTSQCQGEFWGWWHCVLMTRTFSFVTTPTQHAPPQLQPTPSSQSSPLEPDILCVSLAMWRFTKTHGRMCRNGTVWNSEVELASKWEWKKILTLEDLPSLGFKKKLKH